MSKKLGAIHIDEYQVHVYVIKLMEGVQVVTKRDLKKSGLDF